MTVVMCGIEIGFPLGNRIMGTSCEDVEGKKYVTAPKLWLGNICSWNV
jgi:hypothetical protein